MNHRVCKRDEVSIFNVFPRVGTPHFVVQNLTIPRNRAKVRLCNTIHETQNAEFDLLDGRKKVVCNRILSCFMNSIGRDNLQIK